MIDFTKLRHFNAKLGDDPLFLGLPFVPSVEMMLAAANRRDVYRPGDRLADYIVSWDFEPDDKPPVLPQGLVDTYGQQMAFVLCTLSDAWAGCLAGFREWIGQRGNEGETRFVTSWMRALPTRCPVGGWPETKDASTEAHEAHAKSVDTETTPKNGFRSWELDKNTMLAGPSLCLNIMALRARQRDSTTLLFGSFDELVDHDKLPYVPGYTRDHPFDDEDRSAVLISAMWDAAVQQLLGNDSHTPFPLEAQGHAALLVDALSHGRGNRWSSFYSDAPFREVSMTTAHARFKATIGTKGVDWEGEESETGTFIRRRGADLRYPHEAALFRSMLELFDTHERTGYASVPLT
jgi:hypothetical protein